MTSPRIAVGVDFSSEADRAAVEAREIARHLHEELVLVHAATPDAPDPEPRSMQWARRRLGEMRERMTGDGLAVRQALIEGHADEAIGAAARELGADLIVVGSHGRSGVAWLLLGSVSEHVIRSADVDVLVARGQEPRRGGYRHILVATDFSASAQRAFERAVALAAPDATIEVVHFFHEHPAAGIVEGAETIIGGGVDLERLDRLVATGQSFVGERQGPGPLVRLYVVEQPAIEGILHWLESASFDLVVLGSHGRRGIRRMVLGSVAEAVARRAGCSVLVAKGPVPEE